MCGIFAYSGSRQDAPNIILQGLKMLEYRGYDSWGVCTFSEKTQFLHMQKAVGKIGDVASLSLPSSNLGIGHTRWATHGGITQENTHPHLSKSKHIAIVHNGVIENFKILKDELTARGYFFSSETDSEVIAHLIESYLTKRSFFDAVAKTMKLLTGANSFVALDSKSKSLAAWRNGSPLILGRDGDELYLSSDENAFPETIQKTYTLQDGGMIGIHNHQLIRKTMAGETAENILFEKATIKTQRNSKESFPHYMLKEICDQSAQFSQPLRCTIPIDQISHFLSSKKVLFVGCGSAYHACLYGTYLLGERGIMSCAIQAHEMSSFIPMLNKEWTVVAISQSGETADTLYAVRQAKKIGSYILSITNAPNSALARLSDALIDIAVGPEIAVVSTKAFTGQLYALHQICDENPHLFLHDVPRLLSADSLKNIQMLAQGLAKALDVYVIGKYRLYPIALEVALKMKEASYIHAEGFAAGELKHGVISLISQGTPCIVLDGGHASHDEIMSSAIQVKSRGGFIIGIGPQNDQVFDRWIEVPNIASCIPISITIVGQLLGYYLSILRNCDPDKPRNLAKSVTVR